MIVILNNGTRIRVDEATVQIIFQNILNGTAKQWQCIADNKGNYLEGFNLKDISAIVPEKSILRY